MFHIGSLDSVLWGVHEGCSRLGLSVEDFIRWIGRLVIEMVQVYSRDGVVVEWNESATFNVKVAGFGMWMATECFTQYGVESMADAVVAADAWIKEWQKCDGWCRNYCRVHSAV